MSFLGRHSPSQRRSTAIALGATLIVAGCVGPDTFDRDDGGAPSGAGGGGAGLGGAGVGGSAMGGRSGAGGAPGAGGRIGVGGSGMGGALGSGGASTGGRTGSGGSGQGGARGMGGNGQGGAPGGAGGAVADGGAVGAGGCAGVYFDDFETDVAVAAPATGTPPVGWIRKNGSASDWSVRPDDSHVFAQDHALSATFRACYAMAAPGAPWGGATTASARMKVTAMGSSGATTGLLCLRYGADTDAAYCLALLPGTGAQIQIRTGAAITSSGSALAKSIALATWYAVRLSVDAVGLVSASVDGAAVPALMPAAPLADGFVAVATQGAEAAFDNVVVSRP